MDLDSDSGEDLDIERNGSIPQSRANRLRSLLARRKPADSAATSVPDQYQTPHQISAPKSGPTSDYPTTAESPGLRQRKHWETLEPPATYQAYINVNSLSSQKLADGYIRGAWSPSWQERLGRVDFTPNPNLVEARDCSSSDKAKISTLSNFAARLDAVSPENVRTPLREVHIGADSGGRLWESELSKHVQRLIEQAQATIGCHAEEIRRAESVLETTVWELTATSTFQEQMLQNKLDFLSKVRSSFLSLEAGCLPNAGMKMYALLTCL
jgi:hypothetical protein